jgi:hypothetical protein
MDLYFVNHNDFAKELGFQKGRGFEKRSQR